jgi:5'-3' exonuclease
VSTKRDQVRHSEVSRLQRIIDFFKLSDEDRVKICIYSGCDYLSNVSGIGFATAMKLIINQELDKYVDRIFQKARNVI